MGSGYLILFFKFPVIGKFSEIRLWLRISRVSQPKKNPANFQGEFIGKFSEIALWLRISRVSKHKKNPETFQGELGDS